jgi:hypothetical protein
MAKATIFEIRIDTGTASLGKYTFPNKFELAVKTCEVLFKHSAKYAQITVPPM